ncbi:MAG: hypothetical protein IJT49_05950 [Clostridia bacterium]|nr:hypothetical protein [Clostridia bacterium]
MFKIVYLKHGWLELMFDRGNTVTASRVTSADAANRFLAALHDAVKDGTSKYLIFDAEAYFTVLLLKPLGDDIIITAFDPGVEPPRYDVSNPEKYAKKVIFETRENVKEFISDVCDEFLLYSDGAGISRWKANWGEFPYKELNMLK